MKTTAPMTPRMRETGTSKGAMIVRPTRSHTVTIAMPSSTHSTTASARAVIVDAFDTLVVRTERSLPVAAGISDEQLAAGLRYCIDQVITTHDALRTVAEQISEQMGAQNPDA